MMSASALEEREESLRNPKANVLVVACLLVKVIEKNVKMVK